MKQLNEYKEKCASIQVKIDGAKANLKKAEEDLASVVKRRKSAEKDVAAREDEVNELRKKLQAAENALANSKIKLSEIQAEEKRIPGVIKAINAELDGHLIELDKCSAKVADIQAMIDSLDSDDLVGQIDELEISILRDRTAVMEIDGELSGLVEPLSNLGAQLEGANKDLEFLRIQIVSC